MIKIRIKLPPTICYAYQVHLIVTFKSFFNKTDRLSSSHSKDYDTNPMSENQKFLRKIIIENLTFILLVFAMYICLFICLFVFFFSLMAYQPLLVI